MRFHVLGCCVLLSYFCIAQTQTVNKTQPAIDYVQRAVNAASWAISPTDVWATGTVTGTDSLSSEGAHFVHIAKRGAMRYEVTVDGETSVTVTNGANGAQMRGQSTRALPVWIALSSNAATFPFYANFAIGTQAQFSYLGTDTIDGEFADVIEVLPKTVKDDPIAPYREKTDRYRLWFSRKSALLLQMSYTRLGGSPYTELPYVRRYADYRMVNGRLFPFRQLEFLDGKPLLTFEFSEVRFDSGVPDSTFVVPTAR